MKKIKTIFSGINKLAFWLTFSLSAILLIISFIIPPQGVIDASVLAAVGELFAFGTLATVIDGIQNGRAVKLTKGETSIHIEDKLNTEKND